METTIASTTGQDTQTQQQPETRGSSIAYQALLDDELASLTTSSPAAGTESTTIEGTDSIDPNPESEVRAVDREDTSDTPVANMAAADSAPEPDAPEVAAQRAQKINMAVKALLGKGFTQEQAELAVATASVNGTKQRRFPSWAPVSHLFTRTFFADRSDEQLEGDAAKHCRTDGGQLGLLKAYTNMIVDAGADPLVASKAAGAIAAHTQRRIRAIRLYVICTINELRVRRLERASGNVNDGVYLKAR